MRRAWELDNPIDCWTLDEEDAKLLANKSDTTRLAFALAAGILAEAVEWRKSIM